MTPGKKLALFALGAMGFMALQKRATIYAIAEAIGYVESRGNYKALGPHTANGDRAYGKYQVMGNNIPAWSLEVLGRALTPAEWLADGTAQDQVARAKIAQFFGQYGNASDVASVWFSGRPLARAGNSHDVTGTTVPGYVQQVLDAMNG